MLFSTSVASAPSITRTIQASNPGVMERLITQALADIAQQVVTVGDDDLRYFVTDITLAGGGDGHTFVCTIVASVASFGPPLNSLNPAQTYVRCFMASQSEALAAAAVRARNEVTVGDFAAGYLSAGASGGTRFMGILVAVRQSDFGAVLGSPTIYFYQSGFTAIPISATQTPVVVPGSYVFAPPGLFSQVSQGILEYTGDRLVQALVRTRTSVQGAAGIPAGTLVSGGAVRAVGGVLAGAFLTAQTVAVAEPGAGSGFKQVTSEAFVQFVPTDALKQIAVGIANLQTMDDLEVQASMITIQPL